jgi:hypothetical protein
VTSYKIEQRRLTHRGREFHFVSYEGRVANERRSESALPPMWYLMISGKRLEVMPQVPGQDELALDTAFVRWLDQHVFAAAAAPARKTRSR